MKKNIFINLFLILFSVISLSQDLFRIDTQEILVGDTVRIYKEIESGQKISIKEEQELNNIAVLEQEIKEDKYIAKILPLGEGNFKIPPIDFIFFDGNDTKEISSSTFEVNLLSRIKNTNDTKELELRPDNPIKMIKDKWNPYFLTLLIICIIVFILVMTYLIKRKGKEIVFGKKNEPAHVVAYRMLEELYLKDYLDNDKQKAYCVELSFILKNYIKSRFGYDIVEMTTDEVFSLFSTKCKDIPDKKTIVDNLRKMDLVKFARYHLENETLSDIFDFTKAFVKKTEVKENEIS